MSLVPPGKRISREAPSKGYVPFGFGTRSCIGATLALIEGTVMVALLAQKFTFHEVRPPPLTPLPNARLRHAIPHPPMLS
jgi:cytochrome P450